MLEILFKHIKEGFKMNWNDHKQNSLPSTKKMKIISSFLQINLMQNIKNCLNMQNNFFCYNYSFELS